VPNKIVVIGGSAGSIQALVEIVKVLPADLPAAVFVVVHIPANQKSHLCDIFAFKGSLPTVEVSKTLPIECGKIYCAAPDHHMMVEDSRVFAWRGPKEDNHRPSINPLFRSAAQAFGPNVIGVVLSGALDDGTAGLWLIKQRGGIAIVQDPRTAPVPEMPESVLKYVEADHVLNVDQIGPLLEKLARGSTEGGTPALAGMENEAMESKILLEARCPACQGPLSEIRFGKIREFRCMVGHSYSPQNILEAQSDAEENALWSAVAALEESASLIRKMLPDAGPDSAVHLNRQIEKRLQLAKEARSIIERLDAIEKS